MVDQVRTPSRRGAHRAVRVRRPPPVRFRPEVEGLRALATGLVVVHHVWTGRVSGGVDVFFLLSGFLLVGRLTRAAGRGPVDVVAHWGHTLRRLVPTTALVLSTSAVAGILVLPETRWDQTIREVVASALFVQNWRLAADSADYYAAHDRASIVQHLWSLSLQGQVALALPALVAVLVVAARRHRLDVTRLVGAALLVATVVSFVVSVVLTAADQPLAYFHSGARLWEFTLGGLLALVIDRIDLSRDARVVSGWVGVLALLGCGVVLDAGAAFPGWLALWPVLAAALVLVAGRTGHPAGVDGPLTSAPLQYLGAISFPLYLWHWPVLALVLVGTGREGPGLVGGLVVIAISVLLAVATHHLVDAPLRQAPVGRFARRGEYRLAALALVPVLIVVGTWSTLGRTRQAPPLVLGDPAHPGAAALVPGFVDRGDPATPVLPAAVTAAQDWAEHGVCRSFGSGSDSRICGPAGPATGGRRIVVVGDSHTRQFVPALTHGEIAGRWQVGMIFRSACPFSLDPAVDDVDDGCATHNRMALAEIAAQRPDAVLVQGSRDVRPGRTEWTPPGYVDAWRAVTALGIPVIGVRDNPRFDTGPTDCVLRSTVADCAHPRGDLYGVPGYERVPGVPAGVRFLDPSGSYCDSGSCPPVIGRVLVYLDDDHITATYSRTLGPVVTAEVTRLLAW